MSAIRTELERLARIHGGTLLPEQVVEAARKKNSPLHASFEWDNTAAAQQWRLHQARQLLRVSVTFLEHDDKRTPTKTFVSLTADRGATGYRLMVDVLSDDERRAQLLDDARAEMKTFTAKYGKLSELA